METLTTNTKKPQLVTNLEVMTILEQRIKAREQAENDNNDNNDSVNNTISNNTKKKTKGVRHRDWIESQVIHYLQVTPCIKADLDKMPALVSKLRTPISKGGYGLVQSEILQILNFFPTETVELHLIIDDLQSRMSEEKQTELLELIANNMEAEEDDGHVEGDGDDVEMEVDDGQQQEEVTATENGSESTNGVDAVMMVKAEDGDYHETTNNKENGRQPTPDKNGAVAMKLEPL